MNIGRRSSVFQTSNEWAIKENKPNNALSRLGRVNERSLISPYGNTFLCYYRVKAFLRRYIVISFCDTFSIPIMEECNNINNRLIIKYYAKKCNL